MTIGGGICVYLCNLLRLTNLNMEVSCIIKNMCTFGVENPENTNILY